MDMTETILSKSDQINADDLMGGPITVTVTKVTKGPSKDQPRSVHLAEIPDRVYRPSLSMRRVLTAIWGGEGDLYAGRRLTLFRNPEIEWGGEKVGGVEISHASHIDRPTDVSIKASKHKRRTVTVQPLPDPAPTVTVADVEACEDVDQLRAWWQTATEDVKAAITARANTLADLQAAEETVQGELIDDEVQS